MSEDVVKTNKPIYLKVEPKRPVMVRVVKERPLKKKIENTDSKLTDNIIGGVRVGTSFAGGNFGAVDLSGVELLKGIFFKAGLSGSDFSKSDLSDSNFAKANLAHADFSGAILRNVDFKGADLTGADFSNANLEGANLAGAKIKDAIICNTNLAGVKLTKTVREELQRIREAMQEVDLTKVDLSKIDLRYIDFKNVDLRGIDLTGVNLSGVNLVGVNLSGAKIDFSKIDGSHFLSAAGNNSIRINKYNLAGLDPLTVHQVQTQIKQEQMQKEQRIQAEQQEQQTIIRHNVKRPPYKLKEENYVKSKHDFPDLHSSIIAKEKTESSKTETQEQIEEFDSTEDLTGKNSRRFLPLKVKKGKSSKVKVRN